MSTEALDLLARWLTLCSLIGMMGAAIILVMNDGHLEDDAASKNEGKDDDCR